MKTTAIFATALFLAAPASAEVTRAECIGLLDQAQNSHGRLFSPPLTAMRDLARAADTQADYELVAPAERAAGDALTAIEDAWEKYETALSDVCRNIL